MAKPKKNKKHPKSKGGVMGRSDIPYAQRIQMQHRSDVAVNREQAAKVTMFCISVAMYEIKRVAYKRLVRFHNRYMEYEREFYQDPEVGMAHAKARMEQMGMPISGEFYSVKQPGLSKRTQNIHDHALQAAQIALICGAIAMNDEFGFGQERQTRISERSYELSDRYNKEGEGFLLEEMAKIGFPIVNGNVMAYVDGDMKAVHPRQAEVMK